MRRVVNALKADITFQFKQGFYAVYLILTILYTIVIGQLPGEIAGFAVPLVVFSDPSVIGFFFIGGIVMLEKVQGVLQYMAVTPLRSGEYLLAKIVSLTLLAVVAGIAITAVTYAGRVQWPLLITGILLSSAFFTMFGFLVTVRCNTMNEYFIKMVPYMLVLILPCFSIIGFPYSELFRVFPSVAALELVLGAFRGIAIMKALIYITYLTVFDVLLFFWVDKILNTADVFGGQE